MWVCVGGGRDGMRNGRFPGRWAAREEEEKEEDVVSLIVKGALLPGHGLDGAVHRGRFECGCSVGM